MFSQKQIRSIDKRYFNVISSVAGCIVVQSKNTGHYWAISGTGLGDEVKIQHKHKVSDTWHRQAFFIHGPHTLAGAFQAIRAHDRYQLRRRNGAKGAEKRP